MNSYDTAQPWQLIGYQDIASADRTDDDLIVQFANGDAVTIPWTLLGYQSEGPTVAVDEDGVSVELLESGGVRQILSATRIRALTDPAFAQEMRRRDTEQAKRVGVRLKALREDRGLSQRDLASVIGMTAPQLSKIESGTFDLRISTVQTLLRALDAGFGEISDPDVPEISQQAIKRHATSAGVSTDVIDRMIAATTRKGLLRLLQRGFDWTADAINAGLGPSPVPPVAVRFKSTSSTAAAKHLADSPMLTLAWTAATAALEHCTINDYAEIPSDPQVIRAMAADKSGQVTLESLTHWLWRSGVPVIPVHGKGGFAAAAWQTDDRPVIVIKETKEFAVYWLFDLGHELGHVARRHLVDGPIIDVNSATPTHKDDPIENDANNFALDLLIPGHRDLIAQVRRESGGHYLRFKDTVANVAKRSNVNAGLLGMVAAYELTDIGDPKDRWGSASNLARLDGPGRRTVQDQLANNLTPVSDETDDALIRAAVTSP